jgi:hypothetical protein
MGRKNVAQCSAVEVLRDGTLVSSRAADGEQPATAGQAQQATDKSTAAEKTLRDGTLVSSRSAKPARPSKKSKNRTRG